MLAAVQRDHPLFVWFVDRKDGVAAYSPSSRSRASSGSMMGAPSRMG
jgi:hypothetical protein